MPHTPQIAGDEQQHAVVIGQHAIVLFQEQAIGNETGETELDETGKYQRTQDEIGNGDLELHDCGMRKHDPQAEKTDHQDADDGQHPGAGADDARIGIRLNQAEVALLLQQLAQLKAYACHAVTSS